MKQNFQKSVKAQIITLSDRAYRGEYPDKSGRYVEQTVANFMRQQGWEIKAHYLLLPDDEAKLKKALLDSIKNKIDLVFTVGGTGIGTRDIAPDVVSQLCDKTIPGIMEFIRVKYGATIPNALLSRSIAGVAEETLIYTLPGSLKAVAQYLTEIFNTIEHAIYMLHDLGH